MHILKDKYDLIKDYILRVMTEHGVITYQKMHKLAEQDLSESYDGIVWWYIVSVKLELEARNIIERVPRTSSHQLRLCHAPKTLRGMDDHQATDRCRIVFGYCIIQTLLVGRLARPISDCAEGSRVILSLIYWHCLECFFLLI